jgi:hypothetical protein
MKGKVVRTTPARKRQGTHWNLDGAPRYNAPVSRQSSSERVVIDTQGSVRATDESTVQRLAGVAGEYELIAEVPGLVLLARSGEAKSRGSRILMAGEIVGRMAVMELCNIIASTGWRGDLHVLGGGAHRILSFDQGALKHAFSTSADDRLGQVIFRSGLIPSDVLDQLLAEGEESGARLGELLVQRGVVESRDLFKLLQRQAEQIFFGALVVDDGQYAFLLPTEDQTPPPHTLHVPIQGLLMEGVQRIDEMALFRDVVPSNQLCPARSEKAPVKDLDPTAKLVLAAVDGRRNILDLGIATGLDEFATTKAVYHLKQQGLISLRSSPTIDLARVRHLVAQVNNVLEDIFLAVATYGGLAQTREALESWIHGSGYAPFLGEGVDDFGQIDENVVLESVKKIASEQPLEALHQAFHELAAFALFTAQASLPRDQKTSLARDVNMRLKAIRLDAT